MSSRPSRILLIEDDQGIRESISAYLEDCEYDVVSARDGREGLERILSDQPAAVITDLRMPNLDGLGVLDVTKTRFPNLPVIIVSGTAELEDAVEVFKRGAWDYVAKPIHDLGVLRHSIEQCLERSRLIDENRRYRENLERTNSELQETLRRQREDEAAARNAQFQLLPRPDLRIRGLTLDRLLRPSALMSGDFVDYFVIDDDHLGFYVMDVAGHGVSAAFVAILARGYIHERHEVFRYRQGDDILHPGELLAGLNSTMLIQSLGKHLTLFYGVLNTHTRKLMYATGGHYPPPLLRQRGEVRYMTLSGPAVGLFPGATFKTLSVELADQFRLWILSDGIFDALPGASLADRESLLQDLSLDLDSGPELFEALNVGPGATYPDDITLLSIARE